MVHGFFLKGREFHFPHHLLTFKYQDPDEKIELKPFLGEGDVIVTTMQFLMDNEVSEVCVDLSKVQFQDSVSQKPDITKFFVTEDIIKTTKNYQGIFLSSGSCDFPYWQNINV